MITSCCICGSANEPPISKEDEELATSLYDTYSDIAEGEGPGALSDIEFKYICGRVCKKCFLDYYNKEFGKDL